MHTLLMQGTQTGGVNARELELDLFENEIESYSVVLDYVVPRSLTLDLHQNVTDTYAAVLALVVVRNLTLDYHVNVSDTYDVDLQLVPFEAENAETTTLLAAMDQEYSTTTKRQMDALITELKDANLFGTKFDWYGNAYWALSEHDALLNWVNPAQTLTKVGAAFWTEGVGLSGVNPTINSGRYKSGWDVGDGPHSSNVNFAMFCKITDIAVPQNGMLPMGCWALSSPGPAAPIGSNLSLSITAGTGFAGAYCTSGEGNNFAGVGDGTGVWVTSRGSGVNKTFKDGVELDSDSVVIVLAAGTLHADGICVAGSTGSGATTRSFPGTELYWGWGAALTAADAAALESAFQAALLPPDLIVGAVVIDDDEDYWVDESGDYIVEDGP